MRNVVVNFLWNNEVKGFIAISAEELKRIPKLWIETETYNKHLELFRESEYKQIKFVNGKKIERLKILKYYTVKIDE